MITLWIDRCINVFNIGRCHFECIEPLVPRIERCRVGAPDVGQQSSKLLDWFGGVLR